MGSRYDVVNHPPSGFLASRKGQVEVLTTWKFLHGGPTLRLTWPTGRGIEFRACCCMSWTLDRIPTQMASLLRRRRRRKICVGLGGLVAFGGNSPLPSGNSVAVGCCGRSPALVAGFAGFVGSFSSSPRSIFVLATKAQQQGGALEAQLRLLQLQGDGGDSPSARRHARAVTQSGVEA